MTECPRCGAQTGRRCRTKSGAVARKPHAGRRAPYVQPEPRPEWITVAYQKSPRDPWWARLMDWLDNGQPSLAGDVALIVMGFLVIAGLVWAVTAA